MSAPVEHNPIERWSRGADGYPDTFRITCSCRSWISARWEMAAKALAEFQEKHLGPIEAARARTLDETIGSTSGRHRNPDHSTSVAGAKDVAFRAGSQKAKLLRAFAALPDSEDPEMGYTNDEARVAADLPMRSCYWHRVSDLFDGGLVEETGETRLGESGSAQKVRRITDKGREILDAVSGNTQVARTP